MPIVDLFIAVLLVILSNNFNEISAPVMKLDATSWMARAATKEIWLAVFAGAVKGNVKVE